ncbi:MAG: serpin family protein [Candidatus Diapherotrites archaeon]|nr:serpin family protein [Candidatus Diapherotrites archaeon]
MFFKMIGVSIGMHYRGSLQAGILLLIIAALATAAVFFYLYIPTQPPIADETGWTEEGLKSVLNANNEFAFDLYNKLSKEVNGNLVYSPYSIFSALTIVYEGAKGKTASEMRTTLHLPAALTLRGNFGKLYNIINKTSNGCELRTGNALWIQKDYPILDSYKNVVEKYYGAKSANLDFINETERSRRIINSFIEEQTNGRIKELIPPDYLTEWTRMVITNAVYFSGEWKWQFEPKNTRKMDFRTSDGKIARVEMMRMNPEDVEFYYADLHNLQLLELPYANEKISMWIILPKNDLSEIEPITLEKFQEWKKAAKKTELADIYIPKFEFTTKQELKDVLQNLGIREAFSEDADFSGITDKKELFIDFVIHQAYINVHEKGTEAAAATAVGMKLTAVPVFNVFKADHPFVFIIQERETGVILFVGKVVNPISK